MNKMPLLVSVILFGTYLFLKLLHVNYWVSLSVFLIPIIVLVISFVMRKKLKYKQWFLNRKNILIERNAQVIESEIEPSLLLEKFIEIIEESEFKLLDCDRNSFSILCGTPANFITWGENIYIFIHKTENCSSKVEVVTTTIFGTSSWGRNDKNQKSFFDQLDSSLTV